MRRRSRAGGKPVKTRRRTTLKRRNTAKAIVGRSSSAVSQKTKVALLARERDEALEQLSAATEVLKVISSSPGDLKPIFEAILENATRICDAKFGTLNLFDGSTFRNVALHNPPPQFAKRLGDIIRPGSINDRVFKTKQVAHSADYAAEPNRGNAAKLGGARSTVAVPMLKDDKLVGTIVIYRQEVCSFTDKQIALLENFAAQAVIAIENARLLAELRERTDDLTESLEQQTATSKVLEVISRSAFDLHAVFETLAENAVRLCGADRGAILRFDGELLRVAALVNASAEFTEWIKKHPVRPGRHSASARAALEHRTIHIPDVLADPEYTFGAKAFDRTRTILGVPILKGDDLLGVMLIYHVDETRPFTDKQIALVETFADQAAIAIENIRLFEAEQQRTRELTESLEQQTATSEVLQVINSSPGDLEPVFASMLEKAVSICDATFGNCYRWDGEQLHIVASCSTPEAFAAVRRRAPFRPPAIDPVGQMVATKVVVHIPDVAMTEAYAKGEPLTVAAVELGGIRTFLAVPILKDDELVGAFSLSRQQVRLFTDKQIALVTSFAAQAVIAIENARLLNELRQRTDELGRSVEELRALGEVSQAVNSTLDVETVLSTIVAKAVQLSGTDAGAIYVFDTAHREFHLRATYGMDQKLIDALTHRRIDMSDPNVAAVMAAGRTDPGR